MVKSCWILSTRATVSAISIFFAVTLWLATDRSAGRETPGWMASRPHYSGAELRRAVDRILEVIHPARPENGYFPAFAKEKLEWVYAQQRAGALQIVLLRPDNPILPPQALMGSGIFDDHQSILIGEPQLLELMADGSGAGPFTAEQRNTFMLGLVHEAVHLQNDDLPAPEMLRRRQRLDEEARAWREVTMRVVRPLRAEGRGMHPIFIRVDEAFRRCGDAPKCQPLAWTMVP